MSPRGSGEHAPHSRADQPRRGRPRGPSRGGRAAGIVGAGELPPVPRFRTDSCTGKHPNDALVYTPRICGICSVSQSVAAARALADLGSVETAENGRLATNLILAAENLADHLTHFYLFFMPDFAREVYASEPWHEQIAARFKAQTGSAHPEVLRARAELLHLTAMLAGKWPHSPGPATGRHHLPCRTSPPGRVSGWSSGPFGTFWSAPCSAITWNRSSLWIRVRC